MGNHEYCGMCGENNFHYNQDCDPEKRAAFQQAELKRLERRNNAIAKTKKALDEAGLKYWQTEHGGIMVELLYD
jgi:hypothetical protein